MDDLDLGPLLEPRPLIPEGEYLAISRTAQPINIFGGRRLQIEFEVHEGPYARTLIPCWMPLPPRGKRPSRSSNVYRLHQILKQGQALKRGERISVEAFIGKMWLVEVVTVTQDHHKRPLADELKYSKVAHVLERLA